MSGTFEIHVLPRQVMTQEQFLSETPPCSIALDINFDHHDNVVREATMSTAKQVFVAIKGGLMKSFREDGRAHAHIYINDTDQDTSLAVWLLMNYTLFEGTQSVPLIVSWTCPTSGISPAEHFRSTSKKKLSVNTTGFSSLIPICVNLANWPTLTQM